MNRNEKNAALEVYKEIFDGVEALVLTDVAGVPVNTLNEVRNKFRSEGVTYRVVKNSLFKLAIHGTDLEALASSIHGPVAVALKKGDPVSPAKIAIEFAKTNPKFTIKGGYVTGSVLNPAGVESLSKMKGKDELRAELLSVLKAPQTQFVGICNTMVTQVLGVLNARADKLKEAS